MVEIRDSAGGCTAKKLPWPQTACVRSQLVRTILMLIYKFEPVRYPLAYSILVLPLSIVRWRLFDQAKRGKETPPPAAATLSMNAIFVLSGAVNVLLLLTTRSDVLGFSRQQEPPREQPVLPQNVPHIALLPPNPLFPPACPHCHANLSITPPQDGNEPGPSSGQQSPNGPLPSAVPAGSNIPSQTTPLTGYTTTSQWGSSAVTGFTPLGHTQ